MKTTRLALAVLLALTATTVAAQSETELDMRSGGKDPAMVLSMMQDSWSKIDREGYDFCLADTFAFTPFRTVPMEYPRVEWSVWDRQRETEFARRIFTKASKLTVKIPVTVKDRGVPETESATWLISYIIESGGTAYAGDASLDFIRIDKRWYLSGWTDVAERLLEGERSPTSGILRAQFTR